RRRPPPAAHRSVGDDEWGRGAAPRVRADVGGPHHHQGNGRRRLPDRRPRAGVAGVPLGQPRRARVPRRRPGRARPGAQPSRGVRHRHPPLPRRPPGPDGAAGRHRGVPRATARLPPGRSRRGGLEGGADPRRAAARARLPVSAPDAGSASVQLPEGAVSFGGRLTQLAEIYPDRVALTFAAVDSTEQALTWAELEGWASGVAGVLAGHGVGEGATVVVALPSSPEHVVVTLAAWKLGACVCPLRWDLPEWERDRVLEVA